jgi:group I intron endonuclease
MYVGQTTKKNLNDRLRRHRHAYKVPHPSLINKAIQKYGWKNFELFQFEIPNSLLDFFEKSLIEKLHTLSPNGYNLEDGGSLFKHHHEETKKRISASNQKEKHPFWGTHRSQETKKRISEKCRIFTPEESIRRRKFYMATRQKTEKIKQYRKNYVKQSNQIFKRRLRLRRRKLNGFGKVGKV